MKETPVSILRYSCAPVGRSKPSGVAKAQRSILRTLGVIGVAALLLVGGVKAGLASPSTPPTILLYTQSGTVDVSSTYSYYEHHVYDPDGYLIGAVNVDGQIVDANGVVIGSVGAGPA
jgi:hypothetical protein